MVDAGIGLVAPGPRLQTDPLAVGLDGSGAGLKGPGLGLLAAPRGRGLECAPVIEDARNVHDGSRPLGELQHEVPVLGSLELWIEAADLFDQQAPHHTQVAGVHLSPHSLRRPVGLEERAGVVAADADLVLVGVDVVGVGAPLDCLVDLDECMRVELVVMVEQNDELASRCLQSIVGCSDYAAVGLAPLDPHPLVGEPELLEQGGDMHCRRGVVNETQLPVREALGPHRLEHRPQHCRRGVVDRREDRELRGGHPASPACAGRCGRGCADRRCSAAGLRCWRSAASGLPARPRDRGRGRVQNPCRSGDRAA